MKGKELLQRVGFRRKKPETRLGRALRLVERALVIVGLLYLSLQLYPQVLFAHSFSQDGVTVYSRSELPPEVSDRISEVTELLSRSELVDPGQRHRVFVCSDPWLFRLFSPVHGKSFAVSVQFTGHIFVADADLTTNVSRSGQPRFNHRTFSGLVSHEITHGLIRHRLGTWRELRTAEWVKEGYADYIADESSYPEDEGLERLVSGRPDSSKSFQYLMWRKMVEHLVEGRGMSFDEIARTRLDRDQVKAETVVALRKQRMEHSNDG